MDPVDIIALDYDGKVKTLQAISFARRYPALEAAFSRIRG